MVGSMARAAAGVSKTRRAESTPAEQQHGLVEHSRSQPRRLEGSAQSLEDAEQGVDGTLVGENGPLGWCGLTRGTEETPEAHEPSGRGRRLGRHELGAVPKRLAKIEVTRRDAGQPLAHGGRTHTVAASRDRHLGSVANGGGCREDVSNVVDLAGQNVGWQHPLASAAAPAARQPNRDSHVGGAVLTENLHPALDRARSQRQVLTTTLRAHAAAQDRIASARQAPRIAGRLHIQYVDHAHVRLRGRLDRGGSTAPSFLLLRRGIYAGTVSNAPAGQDGMRFDSHQTRATTNRGRLRQPSTPCSAAPTLSRTP
jgi:hypothetical protein